MIKEGKFGVHEMVSLLVIAMTNKIFFSTASRFLGIAATSAWLMTLISCLSAVLLFTFVYLLLKRFPGKNMIEIFDITLGRATGFAFSLALAVAIFFCCSMLLREFTDMARTYIFIRTEPSLISAALILAVVLGAYLGLESIARFAKFSLYFALASILILIFFTAQYFDITNLFPIMGHGMDVNITSGLRWTCTYSEVIFIAILAGSMQGTGYIKKAGFLSLVLSGLMMAVVLAVSVLVLSYPLGQEQLSVTYILAKQIEVGNFLQRSDPLFSYLWFVTTIITICIEFYCGISVYCKAFRLQDHRPLIIPFALIVYAASFIPRDFSEVEFWLSFIRTNGIFIVFGMPLTALIASLLRRKKGNAS